MKTHPQVMEDESLRVKANTDTETMRVAKIIERVRTNQKNMGPWLQIKRDNYNKRYSRHARRANDPWPGASTIWMPVSDLYIGKLTPLYMNLLFGGPRVASMRAQNAQAIESEANANLVMESTLRGNGVNSMPDLEFQMSSCIDEMLLQGPSVLKVTYSYRARPTKETLRRGDLPGVLAKLWIVPEMSEDERVIQQKLDMQRAQSNPGYRPRNDAEIVATFGGPVNPINKRVFKLIEPQLEREITGLYGLDLEEKADENALKAIMAWFRGGTVKEVITIDKKEILEDTPRIFHVPLEDMIVPADALLDFSRAENITQRHRMTETQVREMAASLKFPKAKVETILDTQRNHMLPLEGNNEDLLAWERADRTDSTSVEQADGLFELWETYEYETGDDGLPRLMVEWLEPNSGTSLIRSHMPYDHGQMPFSVIPFEVHEQGYRSPRGVPEIVKDFEEHVSAWFRHLENTMAITEQPMFEVANASWTNPNDIEPQPGLMLPVDEPGSIRQISTHSNDVPIERLNMLMLQWPQQLIGALDTQIPGENAPERRTATEVTEVSSLRKSISGQRAIIFIAAMRRPLQQVWSLIKQYGPREHFVHITGEAPRSVTQHQTRGLFAVAPAASVGDMDPNFRSQQAMNLLATAMQLGPALQDNPKYEFDVASLFAYASEQTNPLLASRFIVQRSDEDVKRILEEDKANLQRLQQIQDVADKMKANAPVSPKEVQDFMDFVMKVAPWKDFQRISEATQQAQGQVRAGEALA